ncbi:DUF1189 family protein [Legionella jordanis]|uniref:DUF1189 domain-containing protein n=1 Tax=Legionella jordanis TaxID=456 RepID=A0A0W0VA18_9GAMM|nr:DUF1189 family protein [Legionella jordanis]KTD16997.1 hypothetical protein Ljor_1303 [Legionella jordanis]RMX03137.1 DUF1189 domain-containing protein [Legionella jordanis]RMX18724.1 DUF1189 domain-containing protein [Legionella jordanis]VEH12808.1 Protein of uncharacterised function (DUF1189) [Legionella jordanis]HAT8713048.1 DUF1189 domain-containing protein [Legionella jordanis]
MTKEKVALRKVDAPFYNYFQALILSFFSSRLYVDVGKRWKGLGILYLLLVVFLFSIPFAWRITLEFNAFFEEQIIEPLSRMPAVFIQNGKVSFDKPMPYLIKNRAGQVVTIIDTTGKVNTIDNRYPYLTALITTDRFFYRIPSPQLFFAKDMQKNPTQVLSQTFSPNINQVFDGNTWIKSSGIERIKFLSQLMVYPTVALLFFAMFLVFYLVFALMGQFLSKLFLNFSISYKQACRLLMVSSTPQLLLLLLALAANVLFPGFGALLIIIFIGYYLFAMYSLKRESQKLVLL